MLDTWKIVIEKNTLKTSPKEQELKLRLGKVTAIGIYFRPGCHDYVEARILYEETQIFPMTSDEWAVASGMYVTAVYDEELHIGSNILKFQGCSPGTVARHTLTVYIAMDTKGKDALEDLAINLKKVTDTLGIT